jgi:hypothetical protein
MVMRTLDLTLEGTTSLSKETATGIKPPGEGKKDQREEVGIGEEVQEEIEVGRKSK